MAKSKNTFSPHRKYKKPPKTAKRLEAKRIMLEAKASKRKGKK